MDCRFASNELLNDIVGVLRIDNHHLQRHRRSHGPNQEYFYYVDNKNELYCKTSELAVVRNILEPISLTSIEILKMCRLLNVKNATAVASFAVELFDRFFGNLLAEAQDRGALTSSGIKQAIDNNLGVNLNYLKTSPSFQGFHFLFNQLACFPDMALCDDYHANFRGLQMRFICLAMCVFVSCKFHTSGFPRMNRVREMLRNHYLLPENLCSVRFLVFTEMRTLHIMKCCLNVKSVYIHFQILLSLLGKYLNSIGVKDGVNANIEKMCDIFLESAHILHVSIVMLVFKLETNSTFNLTRFDHIDRFENLFRDKLALAAGIVASAVWMSEEMYNSDGIPVLGSNRWWLINFLAGHTQLDARRIDYFRQAILFQALNNVTVTNWSSIIQLDNTTANVVRCANLSTPTVYMSTYTPW